MLYKPGPLRESTVRRGEVDTRDLRASCDQLHRELERRDMRNEHLSKELQSLRTSYSNQQRELRMVTATFDKMSAERTALLTDITKQRDYVGRLEAQLLRAGDPRLLEQIDKMTEDITNLQDEVRKWKGMAATKEDKVRLLERDLDAINRAKDIQQHFEAEFGAQGLDATKDISSVHVGREKMRTIYFELGKRQADAHSLAISLAESNKELEETRRQLQDALARTGRTEEERVTLQRKFDERNEENETLRAEMKRLKETNKGLKDMGVKLQAQIEDMSSRLSETRAAHEHLATESGRRVAELNAALQTSEGEVRSLRAKVEVLQQAAANTESKHQLSEQRLTAEWTRLATDRKALGEQLEERLLYKSQMELLQMSLAEVIQTRDTLSQQMDEIKVVSARDAGDLRAKADEATRLLKEASFEIESLREQESTAVAEKSCALGALQRTIEAAKSLSVRLKEEQERAQKAEDRAAAAETLAESLRRAKDQVSAAVLDALNQEKAKSARLEKALQEAVDAISMASPSSRNSSFSTSFTNHGAATSTGIGASAGAGVGVGVGSSAIPVRSGLHHYGAAASKNREETTKEREREKERGQTKEKSRDNSPATFATAAFTAAVGAPAAAESTVAEVVASAPATINTEQPRPPLQGSISTKSAATATTQSSTAPSAYSLPNPPLPVWVSNRVAKPHPPFSPNRYSPPPYESNSLDIELERLRESSSPSRPAPKHVHHHSTDETDNLLRDAGLALSKTIENCTDGTIGDDGEVKEKHHHHRQAKSVVDAMMVSSLTLTDTAVEGGPKPSQNSPARRSSRIPYASNLIRSNSSSPVPEPRPQLQMAHSLSSSSQDTMTTKQVTFSEPVTMTSSQSSQGGAGGKEAATGPTSSSPDRPPRKMSLSLLMQRINRPGSVKDEDVLEAVSPKKDASASSSNFADTAVSMGGGDGDRVSASISSSYGVVTEPSKLRQNHSQDAAQDTFSSSLAPSATVSSSAPTSNDEPISRRRQEQSENTFPAISFSSESSGALGSGLGSGYGSGSDSDIFPHLGSRSAASLGSLGPLGSKIPIPAAAAAAAAAATGRGPRSQQRLSTNSNTAAAAMDDLELLKEISTEMLDVDASDAFVDLLSDVSVNAAAAVAAASHYRGGRTTTSSAIEAEGSVYGHTDEDYNDNPSLFDLAR